eukprot:6260080-Amphidinium_carterae.1
MQERGIGHRSTSFFMKVSHCIIGPSYVHTTAGGREASFCSMAFVMPSHYVITFYHRRNYATVSSRLKMVGSTWHNVEGSLIRLEWESELHWRESHGCNQLTSGHWDEEPLIAIHGLVLGAQALHPQLAFLERPRNIVVASRSPLEKGQFTAIWAPELLHMLPQNTFCSHIAAMMNKSTMPKTATSTITAKTATKTQ